MKKGNHKKVTEFIKYSARPIFWAYQDPDTGQFYEVDQFLLSGVFVDSEDDSILYQIRRIEKSKDGIKAYAEKFDLKSKPRTGEKIELNTQQLLSLETIVIREEVETAVRKGEKMIKKRLDEYY